MSAATAQRMVEVEYVGANAGVATWAGAVTGTRYKFGALDGFRVQQVDERDAERFKSRPREFAVHD